VRLSASQRADVLALYTDGETTAALARQFGVHKDTVRSIVDAAGARRKRRHRMTMADDHVAAQLRGDGGSYAAIAAHFGVAPETIRRRLASSAK
jgi:transposase-like protein